MQSVVNLIYPATCASCGEPVEGNTGLCGACWVGTWFITGHCCDKCGAPLPGEGDGTTDFCDDCMTIARPWDRGRAAMVYKENGRRIVLALKHGDRPDLARPAAEWLAKAGADVLEDGAVLVPIPLHWTRNLRRRYNQSVELARALGQHAGLQIAPRALVRKRRTPVQNGMGYDERFKNTAGAIEPNPKKLSEISGRTVVLIDDVMTSGATLAAAAEAVRRAGAGPIHVLTLARAVKDA